MPTCAIKWCGKCTSTSNYTKDGISFHRFPNNDSKKKEIWIRATRRDNFFPTKHSVICSRHFTTDCFETLKNNRRRLYRSSEPTLYLPTLEPSADLTNTLDQHSLTEDFESKTSKDKSSGEQNCKNTEEQYTDLSPRNRKMKRHIDQLLHCLSKKKKHVKRLQDIIRALKKKVTSLQEIVNALTTKSLVNQENEAIIKSIGVENRELIKRQKKKNDRTYYYVKNKILARK